MMIRAANTAGCGTTASTATHAIGTSLRSGCVSLVRELSGRYVEPRSLRRERGGVLLRGVPDASSTEAAQHARVVRAYGVLEGPIWFVAQGLAANASRPIEAALSLFSASIARL